MAEILAVKNGVPLPREAWQRSTLKALFPDPSSFADMDRAAAIPGGEGSGEGRDA